MFAHGINDRPARNADWRDYDDRRSYLLANKYTMGALMVALILTTGYAYAVALHALFAPALTVFQVP